MTVQSDELKNPPTSQPPQPTPPPKAPPPARRARRPVSIGMLDPRWVRAATKVTINLLALALWLLSFAGTFYGVRGQSAPIMTPGAVWADVWAAPRMAAVMVVVQLLLSLLQYGARLFARDDNRWWVGYLLALGISVWFNVQAYWAPLAALLPWYLAAVLIVAGDMVPELVAVKSE